MELLRRTVRKQRAWRFTRAGALPSGPDGTLIIRVGERVFTQSVRPHLHREFNHEAKSYQGKVISRLFRMQLRWGGISKKTSFCWSWWWWEWKSHGFVGFEGRLALIPTRFFSAHISRTSAPLPSRNPAKFTLGLLALLHIIYLIC